MRNRRLLGSLLGAFAIAMVLSGCDFLTDIIPTPDPAPVIGTPTPATLSYDLLIGETDDAQSFSFTNTGDAELTYAVAVSAGDTWLSIDAGDEGGTLAEGATATVDLSATCADLDDQTATVTISDAGGDGATSRSVAVDLVCGGTESTFFLAAQVGDPAAADTVSFVNSDPAAQDFTVSGIPAWLSVVPTAGTVASGASQDIALTADVCAATGAQEATLDVAFADSGALRTSALTPLSITVFQICSPAPDPAGFDIQLLFFGNGFTAATLAPFLSAEERWESVITGDIEDRPGFSWPADDCFFNEPSFGTFDIDDLAIAVKVGEIDGASGTLARAGPCRIRVGGGPDDPLSITGVMEFDSADIASFAALETVVLHEMGHVVGVGTLWDNTDLLSFTPIGDGSTAACLGATGPNFTGAAALADYNTLFGLGAAGVPVADAGGAGTQCAHWDEQHFEHELMTGFVNSGGANPMSSMTIQSLADIGYTVDVVEADAYAVPACSPNCNLGTPALQDGHGHSLNLAAGEILLAPVGGVTPDGRRVPLD